MMSFICGILTTLVSCSGDATLGLLLAGPLRQVGTTRQVTVYEARRVPSAAAGPGICRDHLHDHCSGSTGALRVSEDEAGFTGDRGGYFDVHDPRILNRFIRDLQRSAQSLTRLVDMQIDWDCGPAPDDRTDVRTRRLERQQMRMLKQV
ncbi:hypothetical protein ACH4PU_30235 [Streptomyces sp. NPDC021100]|uniref:hypothetical protein n=1 Tax=Streptomyces sp. NPDC021100 TaxID=3365114 RepID=UPI00379A584C